MISEKSVFKNNIEAFANKFQKANYEKINEYICSSLLLRNKEGENSFIFEQNVFIAEPKKVATNLANEVWERFKKPSYVRSFISKQVYALYCEGNLLFKFWNPLSSLRSKEEKRIIILTELYDPMTSEERYGELILKLKETGDRSDVKCFFQDGKFKTHKLKFPGLQIFVTGKIVITDNLQNIATWARNNKMHVKHEIGPLLNDPFLERLTIGDIIVYNAAEYQIIPYFELGKKKIASLWVSLKFQLLSSPLSRLSAKEEREKDLVSKQKEQDFQFNPFEITSETCIFGTKLAGKIKDKKNGAEYEYKPHLITQSKGQVKYFL